jgi:putative transposase
VHRLDTIEQLRRALLTFREIYNANWLIERHGFTRRKPFGKNTLQTAALAA